MKTWYDCPVYKYPKRSDRYIIFRVFLKPESGEKGSVVSKVMTPAMKWKMCGVALLCCKD